jgi:putative ABC transport system substrate-binding protein
VRRREFITLVGGAAAWPLGARAQQPRRIGVLSGFAENDPVARSYLEAFRQEMRTLGWIEGVNLEIHVRSASEANPTLMRDYARELLVLSPDVVLANGGRAVRAVYEADRDVPIVFAGSPDPVGSGLVSNMARPGGNITGFATYEYSPAPKLLEVLKELVPALHRVALVFNPAIGAEHWTALQSAAKSLSLMSVPLHFNDPREIARVIESFPREPGNGLIFSADATLTTYRNEVAAAVNERHLPAVFNEPNLVRAGALAAYGIDRTENYRRAAAYVHRILNGTKAGDLPIEQPTKYSLVINLKTAKALGLNISPTLLVTASEVIE